MKGKNDLKLSKFIRTRNRIPINELEIGKCLNCGYEFRGHFCPDCGQEVAEFNRPFGFVVYDFMGNFFAFDTRFLKTFKYLLFYPGYLTTEFFKGRRNTYSPPFRIFVFLSFILFLLLSFLTDKGLDSELNTTGNNSIQISKKEIKPGINYSLPFENEIAKAQTDSIISEIIKTDSISGNLDINLDEVFTGNGNFRAKLSQTAEILEKALENEKDPKERQRIQEYIAMCKTPEILVSAILKYLSWASFLLLPLFALILKLFYIRREKLYIQHLIFSIHLHSFLFMILIPFTLLRLIFDSVPGIVNLLLLGTFPVYLLFALHNYYGQNWPKVILKFFGIGAIYNFMLISVVMLVFLKSLQII